MNQTQWTQHLTSYPDKEFSAYILAGFKSGFKVGFNRAQPLHSATTNLHSNNPSVISEYLSREVSLNRMWKYPCHCRPPGIHISLMGAIPKMNKPGKWRLIVDLSSPKGFTINDGISSKLSSMSYVSLDHLASLVTSVGRGAFLVKVDIKEAYCIMVPIHPNDQHLSEIWWEDSVYIDRMLPFGLRSAPKIFSAIADTLQWILIQQGIKHILHYLDDFILVASFLVQAHPDKSTLITTIHHLGVPLEVSKLEGPSSCLTFLGIEVDTEALMFRLPPTVISCRDYNHNYLDASIVAPSQKENTDFNRFSPICHKNHQARQTFLKTTLCHAKHWVPSRAPCSPEFHCQSRYTMVVFIHNRLGWYIHVVGHWEPSSRI